MKDLLQGVSGPLAYNNVGVVYPMSLFIGNSDSMLISFPANAEMKEDKLVLIGAQVGDEVFLNVSDRVLIHRGRTIQPSGLFLKVCSNIDVEKVENKSKINIVDCYTEDMLGFLQYTAFEMPDVVLIGDPLQALILPSVYTILHNAVVIKPQWGSR